VAARENDPAAVVSSSGAEIDDPASVRHDREVVLDNDDRRARVDEPVEQAEQFQSGGPCHPRLSSAPVSTQEEAMR
jgi:hypothetical protein